MWFNQTAYEITADEREELRSGKVRYVTPGSCLTAYWQSPSKAPAAPGPKPDWAKIYAANDRK